MNNQIGFEYLNNQGKTPFETFLKYTNEKERSSAVLGKILNQLLTDEDTTLLDVGSGNGEYLKLSLNHMDCQKGLKLTLLEPSNDLIKQLWTTKKRFPDNTVARLVHSTFDDFVTDVKFDVILASHLPFSIDVLPAVFGKMLEILKSVGSLIVVLRKKDDIHKFRTTFKSQLMGRNFQSLTIEDAIGVLHKLGGNKLRLEMSTDSAKSKLYFPVMNDNHDEITIIEFLLNEKWGKIPEHLREEIIDYIKQRKGVFRLVDGFAVVRKTQ